MEKYIIILSNDNSKSVGTAENFTQTLSRQYNLNNTKTYFVKLLSGSVGNSVLQSESLYITLDICSVGDVDGVSDYILYSHGGKIPSYVNSQSITLASYDNNIKVADKSFNTITVKCKKADGTLFECDVDSRTEIAIEISQVA